MSTNELDKRPITCPHCGSTDTELFSLYGSTLLSSQHLCHTCRTVFDLVRFDDGMAEDEQEIME